MGAIGTTTIDFGAYPGTPETNVAVTGQAGIVSGSAVEAWIRPVATSDHSVAEHYLDPPMILAGEVSVGVGFTIRGMNWPGDNGRTYYGQYNLWWTWA